MISPHTCWVLFGHKYVNGVCKRCGHKPRFTDEEIDALRAALEEKA